MPGTSEEPVQEGGDRSAFAQAPMTANGDQEREGRAAVRAAGAPAGRRQPEPPRPAIAVLADRIAAALVHHEPGWRLPRHTALARRYNVSTAEIDAAVTELTSRHLVRRLPDGQLYRVSPAEYLIPIEGVPGLASRADPMGGEIVCRSRQASWRQVPEDIGWALQIPPADLVGVVRVQWTVGGEAAAFCTTYLHQGGGRAVHQRPGHRRLGRPDAAADHRPAGPARTPRAASSRRSASRGRSTSSCSRRRPRWPGACAWPPGSPRRW